MFGNLNLKTKIFLLVTPLVIVSFLVVAWVVSSRSIEMAKSDAFSLAAEIAEKYKNEIKAELQGARVTSETLAAVFETLKSHDLTDRDMMNGILQNALAQKEYITAFCIAYDPDKLDGKDAFFAGQGPIYDETGRYAPYWNKLGDSISAEHLVDVDSQDWYIVPKATKHEYITDPYPFQVQGHSVVLASLIFPILHDGEFIGIIASDIVLDKLQEMVTRVNTHNEKGYTGIFSNSGIAVAYPDKQYLAKDFTEIIAYDMLIATPSYTGEAIRLAREYVERASLQEPADAERRGRWAKCLANLGRYAETVDSETLDLSLFSPGIAEAMLEAAPERLAYVREVKEAIAEGRMYISSTPDFHTIYMPIQFSDVTNPWSVAVSIPMDEVLAAARDVRNYVLGVSLLSVCAIALLLYQIAGNLAKPILELAKSAKTIGEGHFDVDVPVNEGNDEIAVLSRAFKRMAEKIDELVKKLQNYARELEEKNENLNRLNEQLVAAKNQAERSNKAKSDFLSHMSHEMRTPLNAIIGMTSIGKSASGSEKKDYAFDKIESASAHLLGVVSDILDMSKIEADKLELNPAEFDFEKMLQKVVNVVNFRLEEKRQQFHVGIDERIPDRLHGDDQRLMQVLTNLLSNAVKFTPENGSIRLDTHLVEERDGICTIQFKVSDTGIGISEDQQVRLFHSFQQADSGTARKFGGTGLGLAISKRIVEMMGGISSLSRNSGRAQPSVSRCSSPAERRTEGRRGSPA